MNTGMAIEEITDAVEAASLLQDSPEPIRWAPGDATLYRVTLVKYDPAFEDRMLIVTVGVSQRAPSVVAIREPHDKYERWTATNWQAAKLPENMYVGIMPLLAALGWAGTRPTEFDPLAYQELDG
jgi:hypothetical protein